MIEFPLSLRREGAGGELRDESYNLSPNPPPLGGVASPETSRRPRLGDAYLFLRRGGAWSTVTTKRVKVADANLFFW